MRNFIVFVLISMMGLGVYSQTDFSETPLSIQGNQKNLDFKNPASTGTSLKMPSVIGEKSDFNLKDSMNARNIKMLPDRELVQAGHGMKIDTKIGDRERGGGTSEHFGDVYMGDIKYSGKYVGVVCRDHEYVDGDRIKISANDVIIDSNFLLTGSFKGVNIDLEKGFNRLDFEAINQGTSGPNTAQVDVFDEQGKLIYTNRWNLSTGSKATLIIVKD